MGRIVQRSLPGIILTAIALTVAAVVSAGTNLNLAWHEVALIALGIVAIASLALAMPPGIFRPLGSPGIDIADVYARTGEIERRVAHFDAQGKRRQRFLWNLLPLTITIVIVAMFAFAL